MTRPILLSNGTLHVGINLYGMVHDLYYPFVGHENHAAAKSMRNRIGIWTEDQFSWLDDGSWQFNLNYEPRSLIGHFTAHSDRLGVTLQFSDCVDSELNIFLRSVQVINSVNRKREIKIFLHQMLLIGNSLNRDTAQYIPNENAILHYKGDRSFAFGAKDQTGKSFDQFSIDLFGIEGREGVYRDAEDGVLSGNAVEFGQVDSIMGFNLQLEAYSSNRLRYWMAVARTQAGALALHQAMQKSDIDSRFASTSMHWQRWLRSAENTIAQLPKDKRSDVYKSLLIIKSQIDHRGAVIASTDTTMLNYSRDSYAYCWPRDAAYALWPLVRMGFKTELKNFFEFCRNGLQPGGFLMHKYQPDGAVGSSWHPYIVGGRSVPPIQEDETALVVFLFGQYFKATNDKKTLDSFYESLIKPAANFMASHINPKTRLPHATYDLWEEKFLTTTYTTAVVYAALCAAANLALKKQQHADAIKWQSVADEIHQASKMLFNKEKGYFYKGFISGQDSKINYDATIDTSSFYGAFMFGLFEVDSPELTKSYETLAKMYKLKDDEPTIVGRYEHDYYNTVDPAGIGNPWFVTSLWMAQYDMRTGNMERAQKTLDWVQSKMLTTGVLSEQINPYNGKFISVAPLTWSQAEFVNTMLDLTEVAQNKGEIDEQSRYGC